MSLTCTCPVSHGDTHKDASLAGLAMVETSHHPDTCLDWHIHEASCITFILKGSYQENYTGREFLCETGSLLLKPGGERHWDQYGGKGARSIVVVLPNRTEGSDEAFCYADEPFNLGTFAALELGQQIYNEVQRPDNLSPMLVEGIVREVLALAQNEVFQEKSFRPPTWLRPVREKIHDEFNHFLGLSDLAQVAGVCPDHLSRIFKATTGVFIGQYIRALRLNWTKMELKKDEKSLATIACEAGFSDQSHFTRAFKHKYLKTPLAFRQLSGDQGSQN